jgi:hypothetical protein
MLAYDEKYSTQLQLTSSTKAGEFETVSEV